MFQGLSAAHVGQLLYLSTTMDYTGCVLPDCPRHTSATLADFLGTNVRDAQRLLADCLRLGYLIPAEDGLLSLSPEVFSRGEIGHWQPGYFYIRAYFSAISALYLDAREQRAAILNYLARLLSYINLRCNVLCGTPTDYQLDALRPLTWAALCAKMGYSRGHAARLSKLLFENTFPINGHREHILVRINGPPGL